MKILFIDLLVQHSDPHGIMQLAACLKNHRHQVSYISSRSYIRLFRKVVEWQPDLVAYSSFSSGLTRYVAFDRALKEIHDVPSIIGGSGPTFDQSFLKDSTLTALCVGEGEMALPRFCANGMKAAPNIVMRGEKWNGDYYPLADLGGLPHPSRDEVYDYDTLLRDLPVKQFMSGRGCPFSCTYCFNHAWRQMFPKPVIRHKPVSYLIDEILEVRARYGLKLASFNDDSFTVDKKWFLEFAERMPRETGVPYVCNTRANLIDDDVAKALSESGCTGVSWSIESGNDRIRTDVLNRNMSREQILNCARLFEKYGVRHRIGNVIGIPGETYENMVETLDLNIAAKPFLSSANIFVPYPRLKLTEYAIKNGYYTPKDIPINYMTRNCMDVPEDLKKKTFRLMCLFPVMTAWPVFRKWLPSLIKLPSWLLRIVYELTYAGLTARVYLGGKPSLYNKLRVIWRHWRGQI